MDAPCARCGAVAVTDDQRRQRGCHRCGATEPGALVCPKCPAPFDAHPAGLFTITAAGTLSVPWHAVCDRCGLVYTELVMLPAEQWAAIAPRPIEQPHDRSHFAAGLGRSGGWLCPPCATTLLAAR